MFFIGQILKHAHMTYSFLELLIFFWLTPTSYHAKDMLYVINTIFMRNQSLNKSKHFHLFVILMLKKSGFFSLWIIFINTFSEAAVRKCSSK